MTLKRIALLLRCFCSSIPHCSREFFSLSLFHRFIFCRLSIESYLPTKAENLDFIKRKAQSNQRKLLFTPFDTKKTPMKCKEPTGRSAGFCETRTPSRHTSRGAPKPVEPLNHQIDDIQLEYIDGLLYRELTRSRYNFFLRIYQTLN